MIRIPIKVRASSVIVFILVWVILMITLADASPFGRSSTDWERSIHEQYGFSFEYPTKWRARKYGDDGFKGENELKVIIHESWRGDFSIKIRVVRIINPTLEKAIQWGEQRIERISDLQVTRGNEAKTELFFQEEVLNGQVIARRRYQGNGILAEDVYIVRAEDFIVITLESPESSFDSYQDEFGRIVSSFSSVD